MASTALQQLVNLQRSMYDRALMEARENGGSDSESIAGYQKEFEASLPDNFTTVPAKRLMESIDREKIILFGDFHSHKQSQRAFLRVLRMYINRPDHAPVVVALEMFKSDDQKHLDLWLKGHINDQELLDAVNYEQTWGFPWNNYRPILEYCKYQNIQVVGINSIKGGKDTLHTRDAHAAKLINVLAEELPSRKIFCMIGEFHLADRHLPSALAATNFSRTPKSPLRIFTNLDKYFFALDPGKIHHRDEYLSLNASTYCIINSPPWIKWHSQSLWEEMRRLGPIKYLEDAIAPDDVEADLAAWEDDDDDLYTDETLDLDYHLSHLQKQLVEFFKVSVPKETFDRFNVVHKNLDEELEHMPDEARVATLSQASSEGYAVDYAGKLVYMPEVSINNMSAAAGQMLFGSVSQLVETYDDADALFVTQCLKFTFGYIANKILNPRLPLHTVKQLDSYVLSSRGKRLIGSMRERRKIAQATLDIHSWVQQAWSKKPKPGQNLKKIPVEFLRLNASNSHELARSLGQLIAEPICRGLIRGKIDTIDIKKWFFRECRDASRGKETLSALILLTGG